MMTRLSIKTITADTSLDKQHRVILANATGGAVAVTLPEISTVSAGDYWVVKKLDATSNEVVLSSTDMIDYESTVAINEQHHAAKVINDGTMWYLI